MLIIVFSITKDNHMAWKTSLFSRKLHGSAGKLPIHGQSTFSHAKNTQQLIRKSLGAWQSTVCRNLPHCVNLTPLEEFRRRVFFPRLNSRHEPNIQTQATKDKGWVQIKLFWKRQIISAMRKWWIRNVWFCFLGEKLLKRSPIMLEREDYLF